MSWLRALWRKLFGRPIPAPERIDKRMPKVPELKLVKGRKR
jgi:hypothetical protein